MLLLTLLTAVGSWGKTFVGLMLFKTLSKILNRHSEEGVVEDIKANQSYLNKRDHKTSTAQLELLTMTICQINMIHTFIIFHIYHVYLKYNLFNISISNSKCNCTMMSHQHSNWWNCGNVNSTASCTQCQIYIIWNSSTSSHNNRMFITNQRD